VELNRFFRRNVGQLGSFGGKQCNIRRRVNSDRWTDPTELRMTLIQILRSQRYGGGGKGDLVGRGRELIGDSDVGWCFIYSLCCCS
jgi:hypothetical protein